MTCKVSSTSRKLYIRFFHLLKFSSAMTEEPTAGEANGSAVEEAAAAENSASASMGIEGASAPKRNLSHRDPWQRYEICCHLVYFCAKYCYLFAS